MGEERDIDSDSKKSYSSFTYLGEEFKLGDHVYLEPGSFSITGTPAKMKKLQDNTNYVSSILPPQLFTACPAEKTDRILANSSEYNFRPPWINLEDSYFRVTRKCTPRDTEKETM